MTFETRDEALDAFEVSAPDYLTGARMMAAKLAEHNEYVTVDMVREHFPPPANLDPRVMGAIFRTPEWEPAGFVNSQRATCHKRPVRQFRRVQ